MKLGTYATVRVTRNYGPFLDKDPLPAGIYEAMLYGHNMYGPTDWLIVYNGKKYYIQNCDIKRL